MILGILRDLVNCSSLYITKNRVKEMASAYIVELNAPTLGSKGRKIHEDK
jgi:hypothetical protein